MTKQLDKNGQIYQKSQRFWLRSMLAISIGSPFSVILTILMNFAIFGRFDRFSIVVIFGPF